MVGTPDTNHISVAPVVGKDSTTSTVYTAALQPIVIKAMPDYVELVAILGGKETDPVQGIIRATAYPYVESDSLKIDQYLEYNIEPKPIQEITRVDTVKQVDSVWVEKPRSWTEDPAVVATGTSAIWLLILILAL